MQVMFSSTTRILCFFTVQSMLMLALTVFGVIVTGMPNNRSSRIVLLFSSRSSSATRTTKLCLGDSGYPIIHIAQRLQRSSTCFGWLLVAKRHYKYQHPCNHFTSLLASPTEGNSNNNDKSFENGGDELDGQEDVESDTQTILDGQELASQFYKQLKERDQQSSSSISSASNDTKEIPATKFSGRAQQPTTSVPDAISRGSLFDEQQSPFTTTSSSSSYNAGSNMEEVRRQELNLASRFEQTIYIQAALIALALVIVLGVGITGGITDGSDRYFGDDDEGLFFDTPTTTVIVPPEVEFESTPTMPKKDTENNRSNDDTVPSRSSTSAEGNVWI